MIVVERLTELFRALEISLSMLIMESENKVFKKLVTKIAGGYSLENTPRPAKLSVTS